MERDQADAGNEGTSSRPSGAVSWPHARGRVRPRRRPRRFLRRVPSRRWECGRLRAIRSARRRFFRCAADGRGSSNVSVSALVDGDASTIIDGFPFPFPHGARGWSRKGTEGGRERRAARRSPAIKELSPSLGGSALVGRPPQLSTEHALLRAPIDPRDAAHGESVVLGVVKDARYARAARGGGLRPSLTSLRAPLRAGERAPGAARSIIPLGRSHTSMALSRFP